MEKIDYSPKWVVANGVNLWTESFGDSKNPAVILIVGAGAVSAFYTDEFCRKMARLGYLVIRYDHRDYGKSTLFPQISQKSLAIKALMKNELPYRVEDLVEDLRSIMDDYKISNAHIVGHSMGGIIAQLFTATYPKRLLSFTSMSVAPASQKFNLDSIPAITLTALYKNRPSGDFEKDESGWLKNLKMLNGGVDFDENQAKAYVREIYLRNPASNVAWNHIGILLMLPDYLEQFRSNRVPGLILHGEKDLLQPVSHAYSAHEIIGNSQLIILPELGHVFFNQEAQNTIFKNLLIHFRRWV